MEAMAKVTMPVMVVFLSLFQGGRVDSFGIPEFLEFGECAPVKPQENLNFERYSGIWFNIEMVPNEYVNILSCAMANYTWEGDLMVVEERGLSDAGMKMRQFSSMYPTEGQPGVLTVNAEGVPSAPYVVVDTDYEHYSCVHSCLAMMGFRAAFSWVFSRHPTLDPAMLQLCHDRLNEWNVDTSTMVPMTQGKECPYTNKLDSLLAYTQRVQSKAKAREMAQYKGKASTTAGDMQTLTDPRREEEVKGEQTEARQQEQPQWDVREVTQSTQEQVLQDRRTDAQHAEEEEAALSGCDGRSRREVGLLVPLLAVGLILMASSTPLT
ncbi:crustacyanin-A2 subunit-like isoform X4 [Eriocheir sinensis]|uniref:crustacyanin-A2 subunit-like isoform X3 n=1 Tax=Eriocheir sinensis TaxID=95602 RepID=UPI0021C7B4CF|nr:crustacyanin-A2 subunit-like isoform X3 [Eriocheir sinensis]XP_050703392.1 crustacyanin-A2 subunit-like isoform X4 [Eriocheir sinensis]